MFSIQLGSLLLSLLLFGDFIKKNNNKPSDQGVGILALLTLSPQKFHWAYKNIIWGRERGIQRSLGPSRRRQAAVV